MIEALVWSPFVVATAVILIAATIGLLHRYFG